MKFELNGMEQRLNAVLEQFVVAKSDHASLFAQTNQCLKNTLSEMFGGCSLWGIKRNEYFAGKVKECARMISSYPQLIDLARKWDKQYNFHTVMYLLFSQGLLSHIDHEEMREWTRKLDEILEMYFMTVVRPNQKETYWDDDCYKYFRENILPQIINCTPQHVPSY